VKEQRRPLRAFRVSVLELVSLILIPVALVAIYFFDFPLVPALAIVIVGVGASMAATLGRFRTERRQIVDAIPALTPESAVVQSSMSAIPFLVYPQFFLERTVAGLSFQRVGSNDERVLIPWSEVESVNASGAAPVKVTIAFHDGPPLRFAMAPAAAVSDSAGRVQAWLRGEAGFPEPYAATRYLVARTPEEGRR
jgi:hypothetical protein